MPKEEKIKEAWGDYYNVLKEYIKHNGWVENINISNGVKINLEFTGFYSRPKSLQGIENNNGWIKIESEADLPKENIDCWFVIDNDSYLGYFTKRGYFVNGSDNIELRFVTHYQPIEKPNPPIY